MQVVAANWRLSTLSFANLVRSQVYHTERPLCLQHVRRDAARRAGLSAIADPCWYNHIWRFVLHVSEMLMIVDLRVSHLSSLWIHRVRCSSKYSSIENKNTYIEIGNMAARE